MRMMPFLTPSPPTATNCDPDPATPKRAYEVPEFWAVQVRPSSEVRMVPLSPTATNCEPDQATPPREIGVPEVWAVQMRPSGEVRMVPVPPTATNCERKSDQTTPLRGFEVTTF